MSGNELQKSEELLSVRLSANRRVLRLFASICGISPKLAFLNADETGLVLDSRIIYEIEMHPVYSPQ